MTIERRVDFLGIPVKKSVITGPYYEELSRKPRRIIGDIKYEFQEKPFTSVEIPAKESIAGGDKPDDLVVIEHGTYMNRTLVFGDGDRGSYIDSSFPPLIRQTCTLRNHQITLFAKGPRRLNGLRVRLVSKV